MTPSVEVIGVSKVYKYAVGKAPQVAVDDLTLTIAQGQTTGLVGANGAGKTTTIRLILGLIRPDKGEVRFAGKALSLAAKSRIGYMPEVGKLPSALTPEEILDHALQAHRPPIAKTSFDRRARVTSTLTDVGLVEHRQKRIGKLSKGMGRRLAFALATIHQPDLLILDEPTSGLDPIGQRDLLSRIDAAKAALTTILLCTHELGHVTTLCETVHVLSRGKLVHSAASGVTSGGAYQIQLSGANSEILARLGEACGLPRWTVAVQTGYLTRLVLASYADGAQWMQALLAEGIVVLTFGEGNALGEDDLLAHFDDGGA